MRCMKFSLGFCLAGSLGSDVRDRGHPCPVQAQCSALPGAAWFLGLFNEPTTYLAVAQGCLCPGLPPGWCFYTSCPGQSSGDARGMPGTRDDGWQVSLSADPKQL